jgi:hypothetical protein
MVVEPPPAPHRTLVTATALVSDGRWLVRLAGAPEISVQVPRLADVDAAMSEALARDLGRDRIDARVHIRWFDAAPHTSP